jgi:hypothetical protein
MHEIKQLIRRNPDWLRRRAHRAMLLAMVRRMNAKADRPAKSGERVEL